jgi:hypothetical protein
VGRDFFPVDKARRSLLKWFGVGAAAPVAAKAVEMLPKELPAAPVPAEPVAVEAPVFAGGDTWDASMSTFYCATFTCGEIFRVTLK